MKPVLAWAIVENGKLACYDYRLPITWFRPTARRDVKKLSIGGRVIRVEIREVTPMKTKAKRQKS